MESIALTVKTAYLLINAFNAFKGYRMHIIKNNSAFVAINIGDVRF